jgi:ketosteroid isomerase-like protein
VVSEIDRAFATADPALLAGLVTEDAVWMAPEEPLIRGRAAVEERYRGLFGELHDRFSEVTHSMEVAEVCVCGEWAISRGSYRLTLTLPNVPQPIVITGKNVHTYRKQHDGSWLIASDIWNTDAAVRRGPPQ